MYVFIYLKILLIFREKEREGDGEGERHQCEKHWSVASHMDNPVATCAILQDDATTEPHRLGQNMVF